MLTDSPRPGTAEDSIATNRDLSDATDHSPPPIGGQSASDSPLQSLAVTLEFQPTRAIARTYEEYSRKVANLEAQLGAARPILRMLGVKFAYRLRREDRHGCGLYDGVFYRSHKDGSGVRRESNPDPRWKGSKP